MIAKKHMYIIVWMLSVIMVFSLFVLFPNPNNIIILVFMLLTTGLLGSLILEINDFVRILKTWLQLK